MKWYDVVLPAVAVLSVLPCPGRGQQPAGNPAVTNAPGQKYPRMHPDLSAGSDRQRPRRVGGAGSRPGPAWR